MENLEEEKITKKNLNAFSNANNNASDLDSKETTKGEDEITENDDDESKLAALKKFLKSKFFRAMSASFLMMVLLLYFIPTLFSGSVFKNQLEIKISKMLAANFTINGEITIMLLPSPTLILEDVILQNYKPKVGNNKKFPKILNFYVQKLHIRFPIISFSKRFFAKKVIFVNPAVEIFYELNQPQSKQNDFTQSVANLIQNRKLNGISAPNFLSNIFTFDSVENYKIKELAPQYEIRGGKIAIYDTLAKKKDFTAINGKITTSNNIDGLFKFKAGGIDTELEVDVNFGSKSKTADSLIHLSSPILNFKIQGVIASENFDLINSEFVGKINMGIFDLKSFYKNYVSAESIIFYKIKDGVQPIVVSADVKKEATELSVNNLQIVANSINGSGNLSLSFAKPTTMADINLNLEFLDIDNLWSSDSVAVESALTEKKEEKLEDLTTPISEITELTQLNPADNLNTDSTENKSENSDTTSKNIKTEEADEATPSMVDETIPTNINIIKKFRNVDLNAEITIKNARYMSSDINEIDAYFIIGNNGEILLMPITMKVPGEGEIRANGAFTRDGEIIKFVGNLDASGKKFGELLSWFRIESQNLKFGKLDNYQAYSNVLLLPNTVILSNLYLNFPNTKTSVEGEIKSTNRGKSSDITSNFDIYNLKVDDYFLTSEHNTYLSPGALIKKMLWLNDINSNNDLAINFHDLNYDGLTLLEQSIQLRFGHGYFEVPNFKISTEKSDFSGSMTININNKSPQFDLIVKGDKFSYSTFGKVDDEKKKNDRYDIFDRLFFLPSLEGLNGKILFDLKEVDLDDLTMQNFKFTGALQNGDIENASMSCSDIYNGTLTYAGFLGIKLEKSINGSLNAKNISLRPFLRDAFKIRNVDGIANIAANITSIASDKESFFKQLSSEIKFNINTPIVEYYGLNDLVRKMFALQNYRQELQNPENILLNSNSKTVFTKASGAISLNANKGGKLRIDASAPSSNSIMSGSINNEYTSADLLLNTIFLTGTIKKQIPINIASSMKGPLSNLQISTNLNQVRQYLGLPLEKTNDTSTQQTTSSDPTIANVTSVDKQKTDNIENTTIINNTPNNIVTPSTPIQPTQQQ